MDTDRPKKLAGGSFPEPLGEEKRDGKMMKKLLPKNKSEWIILSGFFAVLYR